MKKITGMAAWVAALSSAAFAANGHAQFVPGRDIRGSDTLENVTKALISNSCGGLTTLSALNYVGGGSGTGSSDMIAQIIDPATCLANPASPTCHQVSAPMSRLPNAAECTASATALGTPTNTVAQSVLIGLDGIVFAVSKDDSAACGGGHSAHEQLGSSKRRIPEDGVGSAADRNAGEFPYAYVKSTGDWKAKMRTLFLGSSATPNGLVRDCASTERKTIAQDYSSVFLGGCTANQCQGQNSKVNTDAIGIRHAYRRGDTSGTTDTFLSLIGGPAARDAAGNVRRVFCNGFEDEDRDPIRRDCQLDELVCNFDGTLGVVLPVVVPVATQDRAILYNCAQSPAGDDIEVFGGIRSGIAPGCRTEPQPQFMWGDPNPADGIALQGGPSTLGYNLGTNLKFPNNPRCDCRYPTPEDYLQVADVTNPTAPVTVPHVVNQAFAWNRRSFSGGCPVAARALGASFRFGVMNGDDGTRDNTPATWGGLATFANDTYKPDSRPANNIGAKRRCCTKAVGVGGANTLSRMDPRLLNLAVRNPTNSAGALFGAEAAGPGRFNWVSISAYYRIHACSYYNADGSNHNAASSVAVTAGSPLPINAKESCLEADATLQIGCMTGRVDPLTPNSCEVGFAGREAAFSLENAGSPGRPIQAEPFSLDANDGTAPALYIGATRSDIQALVSGGRFYPFSRKLYFNSMVGFNPKPAAFNGPSSYYTQQYDLYKCMATATPVGNALKADGFIEVPGGGPQLCSNVCTAPTTPCVAPPDHF